MTELNCHKNGRHLITPSKTESWWFSVQYLKVKLHRMLQSVKEVDTFVPIRMKKIDHPVSSKTFFLNLLYR